MGNNYNLYMVVITGNKFTVHVLNLILFVSRCWLISMIWKERWIENWHVAKVGLEAPFTEIRTLHYDA